MKAAIFMALGAAWRYRNNYACGLDQRR